MKELEFLYQHCEFNNKYDCYVLLAVSRKKDTPEITGSQEIVFRKVIKKPEDISRKYLQILAEVNNYRDENNKPFPFYIYCSLNARDSYKATHVLMSDILHWIYEEKMGTDRSIMFKRVDGYFYSALMKPECRTSSQKYFFIDYDDKNNLFQFLNEIDTIVQIVCSIETRNGFHIKTRPFDIRLLEHLHSKYTFEIKRDANIFIKYIGVDYNGKD